MSFGPQVPRRAALQQLAALYAVGVGLETNSAQAADDPNKPASAGVWHRVGAANAKPDDKRLGDLIDYNGTFPWSPSPSPEAWKQRAEEVRRQMLVACGLWPMPPRPKIEAVVFKPVELEEYSVARVRFESSPGLFVTGSLYRPTGERGGNAQASPAKKPLVLSPHGHWNQGRFHRHNDGALAAELKSGGEKFEESGRHPLQARCVQLARMGCVVFHYDMLGYADNAPLSFELAHRFAKQRPEMNAKDHWGLFSAQSELRLFNALGLQTWNSIRALDWAAALPDVDPSRIGVTGASGGGTQSFMLAALDERITAAFPAVMVSTAMQGGCTCENASYLRVNTGNIEFAALVAPRPIGMSAANDWTKELETKGLPELKQHFAMLGVEGNVEGKHFPYPHNFNFHSRAMMYDFFNRHLRLGHEGPIVERDFAPLTEDGMTVWTTETPKPACDDAADVALMRTLATEQDRHMATYSPRDPASLKTFREIFGGGWQVIIGRKPPSMKDLTYEKVTEVQRPGHKRYTAWLRRPAFGETSPTVYLLPDDWNGQVVVWLHDHGKQALFSADGEPTAEVAAVLKRKAAVAGVDLLHQGEYQDDGLPLLRTRSVNNPREFLGYTAGYNHPLFSQRVHDAVALLTFAKHHPDKPTSVFLLASGDSSLIAAAACATAPGLVDRLSLDLPSFRFSSLTDVRDPRCLPGALKYGDVPGLLSLLSPTPLRLSGVAPDSPSLSLLHATYLVSASSTSLTFSPTPSTSPTSLDWLLS